MFVAFLAVAYACCKKKGKKEKKSKEEKAAEKKAKADKKAKEAALEALAGAAGAAADGGKSESEQQKEAMDNLIKDGRGDDLIDMFLNDAFTPGIDDSPSVLVNPVLAYIVNQERAKLKAEEDAKKDDDGEKAEGEVEETKQQVAVQADDDDENPNRFRKRNNFSSLKMLGWDLKKTQVQDEGKHMKEVKIVEGHLQKTKEIDIKKVPLKPDQKVTRDDKRYQSVRVVTYNAVKAALLVYKDKTNRGMLTDERTKQRANAASGARKQLAKKVLKTKVDEVDAKQEGKAEEEDDEEKEEGDEKEEGQGGAKEAQGEGEPAASTPPELTCSICLLLYLDPQVLPCGHHFCHECILDTWQVTSRMACPTCNTKVWKRELKPMTSLATKVDEYKKANNISDD